MQNRRHYCSNSFGYRALLLSASLPIQAALRRFTSVRFHISLQASIAPYLAVSHLPLRVSFPPTGREWTLTTCRDNMPSARRVARGGYPPPALTEPDLWATHPALRDIGVGAGYYATRLLLLRYRYKYLSLRHSGGCLSPVMICLPQPTQRFESKFDKVCVP